MSLEMAGQLAVAVIGLLSALVPFLSSRSARRSLRDDLRGDVALLKEFPAESPTAVKLARHIDHMVDLLIADLERKRDPFGVGLAIALIAVATGGGIWAIDMSGRWLWVLVPSALLFLVGSAGLAQDVTRSKRDEKGRPIPS